MKRVIVIGGGFAGLSTSVYLSENNCEVTLLEGSPKLGGRAYSIGTDTGFGSYDNGQHILMGCYEETIAFLKKIKTLDKLNFQKNLSIPFLRRGGIIFRLSADKYFYPLNLLHGIMGYKALSLKERFKVIDFFLDLIFCDSCDLNGITVREWLNCKKQSGNSIKALWEILVVGALNTTVEKASAEVFSSILKKIFLEGNNSATILLPEVGLSDLYCNDASEYIKEHGGKILLSEKALRFEFENNVLTKIQTDKNIYDKFDSIVFATPAYSFEKIVFESNCNISTPEFQYSPIVNVHLKLSENPFKERFYGLIDSKIHWVFNHHSHITLMVSAADRLINMDSEQIIDEFVSELEKYFPIFQREIIVSSKVIKEKRATFIPDIASSASRKDFICCIGNLFVAGDWIDTGLPSTIESAVLSGRMAAHNVISSLK
ncbi:MAG: hypothetical protein CVV24_08650 [Ignavibacteriae bacterium HGW-Ignavibacteriae-3]|nr:MAG: hypothetical protein CVV24_08650 [Ignavibacteriae bacterium HGW-Ignavibacteriae-3]